MSGKYIVVFKDSATPQQIQEYIDGINNSGGSITNRYESTLKGFAATIPESYFQQLQADSSLQGGVIDYIEPDGIVTTQ